MFKKMGRLSDINRESIQNNGDYASTMNNFLNDMYGDRMLFKPTMAKERIYLKEYK